MELDPGSYAAQRFAALKHSPLDSKSLRERLSQILGNLDAWEKPPLDAQIYDSRLMDGYRRETVTFTTRPGLTAFGYFLIPDGLAIGEKRPAVLCVPGHGRGADSIVGIAENGTQTPLSDAVLLRKTGAYALESVGAGYPTLALEPIGFGHRRRKSVAAQGPGASSCHEDAMAALMLGETLIGWRVWDCFRALDFLQRRDEVNPAQLATVGISGGGLLSLFTAALDTRVAACIVSCYLNTFADSVLAVRHCVDNYAPGLLALCEMDMIAALVAPRALYAEAGRDDPLFPASDFEKVRNILQNCYNDAGASRRLAFDLFDGGHQWSGAGVWPFLDRIFTVPAHQASS